GPGPARRAPPEPGESGRPSGRDADGGELAPDRSDRGPRRSPESCPGFRENPDPEPPGPRVGSTWLVVLHGQAGVSVSRRESGFAGKHAGTTLSLIIPQGVSGCKSPLAIRGPRRLKVVEPVPWHGMPSTEVTASTTRPILREYFSCRYCGDMISSVPSW